jgi:endoglucanase
MCVRIVLGAILVWAALGGDSAVAHSQQSTTTSWIRVNQLGYLPVARKVAVICSLETRSFRRFTMVDERGRRVLRPQSARPGGPFGPCASTHRLDFSRLQRPGTYRIIADDLSSPPVRIGPDVYRGAADTLLAYMRQQRSGFNPIFRDSVHHKTDAILVDHPGAFGDAFDTDGLPDANGLPDVLDEARHGLEWLLRMYPEDDLLLNQLGNDRDHSFPDLPVNDSSDYGWGKGGFRPVYPCTGKPQGLLQHKNRSDGMASTAGKIASAMALGALAFRERDPAFAATLRHKAAAAYELGREHPGVCQTAPAKAPYFYEAVFL